VSPELLDKLLAERASTLSKLGARVIQVASEEPGYPARNAIDGDPFTFWHTRFGPVDPMPHQIVIDIGREIAIKGFTYLPRQDLARGHFAQCAVYCSNDPSNWGEPVATANFKGGYSLDRIDFKKPVKARYLKFAILSAVDHGPLACAAEIDVVPEKPQDGL